MKKIIHLLFFLSIFSVLITSCDEEDIDDPFEDPRDQYLGMWLCTEDDSKNTEIAYTVTIDYDGDNSSRIRLFNFNLFGPAESVHALVTGNLLTVINQTVLNTDVYGKGNKIDENTINWEYYVNDGADIDTISAVYTRQ